MCTGDRDFEHNLQSFEHLALDHASKSGLARMPSATYERTRKTGSGGGSSAEQSPAHKSAGLPRCAEGGVGGLEEEEACGGGVYSVLEKHSSLDELALTTAALACKVTQHVAWGGDGNDDGGDDGRH